MAVDPQDVFPQALYDLYDGRYGQLSDVVALQGGQSSGFFVAYATRSELDADLAHDANTPGIVVLDATPTNNCYYIKVGASGAGSWSKANWPFRTVIPVSEYASLTAAVSSIGSTPTTLLIDATTTVPSNTTIPATLAIQPMVGALIDIGSGQTLTFSTPPLAGPYQIFNGSGAAAGLTEAYPEWFGAAADGSTDDTAAVEAAITSLTDGGILQYRAKSYAQNVVAAKSNVEIRGQGRCATVTQGGEGGTILVSYSEASPCLQIGDGTNPVFHVTFHGFSVRRTATGAVAGNDGIKIYGASQVYGYDFNVLGFGGDNISITSTASRETSGIKLSMFDSSHAWGSNYRVDYGDTYVTDLGIANYHMTGRNYTGAYSVYLYGGIKLFSHAGYIDTGGNRQGHVYLSGINDTIYGGMIIDGSHGGATTDVTVECNYASRSYPSNVLIGNVTFNKSFLWGDGQKTAVGDPGGGLPYNVATQQIRAGKVVLSASPATLADAATDSQLYASGNDVWIINNSTSNNCFIRMGAGGYIQIGGTGARAGCVTLAEITSANAINSSIFIDSADHILKFKDSAGTAHALY